MSLYLCSLTGKVPKKPVVNTKDSRVYEETNVKKYLNFSTIDPFNQSASIAEKDLQPIPVLKPDATEEEIFGEYIKRLRVYDQVQNSNQLDIHSNALKSLQSFNKGSPFQSKKFIFDSLSREKVCNQKGMESQLEKQEFMDRFAKESKASQILGKRVKTNAPLAQGHSRFVGARIKEYFKQKGEERDMLREKKESLQRSIAQMMFAKQNYLQIVQKVQSQKSEIQKRIKQLKEQLGDQLDLPMEPGTKGEIQALAKSMAKTRKNQNSKIKKQLSEARGKTKTELLSDPDYKVTTEAELKEDVEFNMYPAHLNFSRLIKVESEIQILRNFAEKNMWVYLGKDSFLRVVDWSSLRILGLVRVNTFRPVLEILVHSIGSNSKGIF